MTLHSAAEGIGLGVSFGSGHASFGPFIAAALAVHNVPEGLLIASQLLPRGVSPVAAALAAVATSLPQPIMAVPAYLAVHAFAPILSLGLGFAAGAMTWVACAELLPEAAAEVGRPKTAAVALLAAAAMTGLQYLLKT